MGDICCYIHCYPQLYYFTVSMSSMFAVSVYIQVSYSIFNLHSTLAVTHFPKWDQFLFSSCHLFQFSKQFLSGTKESTVAVEQACSQNWDFNNGPICSRLSGSANPQHNQAVTDGSGTAENSTGIVCECDINRNMEIIPLSNAGVTLYIHTKVTLSHVLVLAHFVLSVHVLICYPTCAS